MKYWLFFKISLQDILTYRFDLIMRTFRYAMNIVLISFVWLAIARETTMTSINTQDIVRYYFFTAILYGLSNFHTDNIEEDIRLGAISKYLVKPINAFWLYFIYQGTTALLETVIKMTVMVPLLFVLGFSFGIDLLHLLGFSISLPIIFFGMFSLYFGLSCLAFWFQAVESIRISIMFCFRFLSGIFVPLIFMPPGFLSISRWLPFQNLAFQPVEFLQGKLSTTDSIAFFVSLVVWTALFFLFQNFIWRKATHSYESTGI